jgi:hypothetical protein
VSGIEIRSTQVPGGVIYLVGGNVCALDGTGPIQRVERPVFVPSAPRLVRMELGRLCKNRTMLVNPATVTSIVASAEHADECVLELVTDCTPEATRNVKGTVDEVARALGFEIEQGNPVPGPMPGLGGDAGTCQHAKGKCDPCPKCEPKTGGAK